MARMFSEHAGFFCGLVHLLCFTVWWLSSQKKNYQRFQIFIICADAFSILHEMLGVKPGRIFHASMGLRLLPFFQNHIKDEAENTGDKGNGIGKEENRW